MSSAPPCHFGLDTLAWARAGVEVVGLDFSPSAIDAGRDLARRAGLSGRATFVCGNVVDAVDVLDHDTFDVVYVSSGALCWLPSVDRWASQVGALVAPGGCFYLHDSHPVARALADEQLCFEHSYFQEAEPYVDDAGMTYSDADRPLVPARSSEWNQGIGETVTALIGHGLRLEWLHEHDWTDFPRLPWLVVDDRRRWCTPEGVPRVPLSFSLLASRSASA